MIFQLGQGFELLPSVKAKLENNCQVLDLFARIWDHPFKTSACFRGGGMSPLPTFADARGVSRGLRNADVSNF